jgi:hypothetical protein
MAVEVILGLPYLSGGALTRTARELRAPVLLSANSFSRWRDQGQVPPGWEFTRLERAIRASRGDDGPPSAAQSRRRVRDWTGWNLSQMRHAEGLREIHLDSAGFHAQAAWGGFPWTPESYVLGLCAAFPWTRFSSMDLCVEEEVARDRIEVRERIAKTVRLNLACQTLAKDAGIAERLMPVIQGSLPDDYLRCYDSLSGMIGEERVVGVGSMCRRQTGGDDGIVAVVEALDRELPRGVRLHLFGLKSDAAEAVASLDERIASIDSQAYGVTARKEAGQRRLADPSFSKSNAFVAEIMADWYRGQRRRMALPRPRSGQTGFAFARPESGPQTVMEALELHARRMINELIEDGALDHDQIVTHHWLDAFISDWTLPDGVGMTDPYLSEEQLPRELRSDASERDDGPLPEPWLVEDDLHDAPAERSPA